MEHIVSFSGGKDSTAMLLMMLERGVHIDRVINVDTGKEFPQMYDHIQKVQDYIGMPIEVVKIDFDYWLGEHIKQRGAAKGKRGYGWPDSGNRWCTSLKVRAFAHAVARVPYDPHRRCNPKTPPVVEYHGIAADEHHRLSRNADKNIVRPLVDWGITEAAALSYCYKHGFTWDGLYEEGRSRVSCYCCPLQRVGELKLTWQKYPELWDNIRAMDARSFRQFRPDRSLAELEARFAAE